MDVSKVDAAIAFERYRLQIIATWPECDFKQDTLRRVERSLHRLLVERQSGKRCTGSQVALQAENC
jgi:hypothetical protein